MLVIRYYTTIGLDASDTGHLVNTTLWKLCVWTAEEVWLISITPATVVELNYMNQ